MMHQFFIRTIQPTRIPKWNVATTIVFNLCHQRCSMTTAQTKQQQQHSGTPTKVTTTTINVITLVTPNPMRSQRLVQHLQKWTQEQQPEQMIQKNPSNDDNITNTNTDSDSTKSSIYTSFHYNNNSRDKNDVLDEYLRSKTMNRNTVLNLWNRFRLKVLTSGSTTKVDSLLLNVGSNTYIHCIAPSINSETNLDSNDIVVKNIGNESSLHHPITINLLAIQSLHLPVEIETSTARQDDMIRHIRDRLARSMAQQDTDDNIMKSSFTVVERIKYTVLQWLEQLQHHHYQQRGTTTTTSNIFPLRNERLPIIDLKPFNDTILNDDTTTLQSSRGIEYNVGELKEIVLPYYWTDTYSTTKLTIIETLQSDVYNLHRPVTGLYQISNQSKLSIRPLPMGKEDRNISCCTPTFVFHTNTKNVKSILDRHDQQQQQRQLLDERADYFPTSTTFYKIGYTGRTLPHGQLMVNDTNVFGKKIQLRLCTSIKPTSMFAEAQDSLFASSLNELQSHHVLSSSSPSSVNDSTISKRSNDGDCWVEFRANVRHPLGYVSSSIASLIRNEKKLPTKVAKVPDLPYE